MADKVYIGYGNRIEIAYDIKQSLVLHLGTFGNSKEDIFNLAQYNGNINKKLNPESTFVVVEDIGKRLRGQICGTSRDEKYIGEKMQVLKAPDFTPLREYLNITKGDRVVVTNDSLADKVDNIVKEMGYETIHFA
ncbi:MAG: hypothetical protein ACP5NV_06365 [Candidatus Woesearchaeota archaeon]